MEVPFNEIDHLGYTRENITEQFKNKAVIDKYLQLLFYQKQFIQSTIKDLVQSRSIDEAYGAQLDIIGEIVGQPRTLISFNILEYFAFLGYPNAQTFGDLDDPSIGGFFYSLGDPIGGDLVLTDEVYRYFIKAKIIKNNTASTPNDVIAFIVFLLGEIPVYLRDGGAEITIFFGRDLSNFEQNLLNFISYDLGYGSRFILKTLGVRINLATYKQNAFFAFKGFPGAKGFGSLEGVGWDEDWGESWDGFSEPSGDGGYFATYL